VKKILLMGNPNVGKSVIFSRLTGVNVIASNYPGTTVEFTRGYMKLGNDKVEIIDVPGTYSLEPESKAEQVAVEMLKGGDLVINVVDSTNLERNLNLTLELLRNGIPVVVALNLWDEARHIGVDIDEKKLRMILGVPVVPTCAITGEGIRKLVAQLPLAKADTLQFEDEKRWEIVGKIVERVQKITHRHHTILERLEDISIKPVTGVPLALLTVFLVFTLIRFIGESLISYILEPIFEGFWAPLMLKLSALLGSGGFFHNILIGKLVQGEIDFVESLGLLTTGLFVPFAMVLPYVVLPMILALGCNVPGVLATRVLETRRERFIAMTLMCISVPCMAQIAVIAGLIGRHGAQGMGIVFGTLFLVWVIVGFLLNKLLKGESPEIFVEIPPYRLPYWGSLFKKLWIRIRGFLKEAIPFVLLGVLMVNLLYTLSIIKFLGRIAAPVVTGILGLPREAVGALIIGFLRKDVAVGMLLPLGLDVNQLIVASVVLAMYFPCVATFVILLKEMGVKDMLKTASIMTVASLIVGGILNLVL